MLSKNYHSGFDSSGRYDGTKKYYHAFETKMDDAFDSNHVSWITNIVQFPEPITPAAALAREAAGASLPGDYVVLKDYRKTMKEHNKEASKALSILKSLLGPVPTAAVDVILNSNILSPRVKILACRNSLRQQYGQTTATTISAHIADMDELPPIFDAASAQHFMSSLVMLNSVLRRLNAAQTDDQLRQRLYKNLVGPMFEKVALDIAADPAMTFAAACTSIQNIIDVKDQRDNHMRHLSAMHPTIFAGLNVGSQIQSAWSTVPVLPQYTPPASYAASIPTPTMMSPVSTFQPYPGYPPIQSQPSSVNPAILAMQAPPPHVLPDCWNCFGHHRSRDCPAPFCRNCNSSWDSLTSAGYHLFIHCPNRPARKQPREPSRATRPSPAKPVFDYRNKRRATVNSMTGAPQFDLDAMCSYNDAAWDSYLSSQSVSADDAHDDDDQDYSSVIARNTMMCAQTDDCSSSTVLPSTSSSLAITNAMRTLQDSGANVSATPPITAVALGLTIYKWVDPFLVTFGNGTSALSNHYVYLGPLLGKTAILNSCTHTVLSVPDVNSRGFDVLFSKSMRCFIWNSDGDLIVEAPIDKENRLYYVDLQTLLLDDLTPSGGCQDRA